ncbi:MAG TPA: hypothetical protein VFE33_16980 [Thermoanaerobaculia bacterium]|nr:hypothetical protein [Thermoanaerobaculia bacterium]
MQKRRPKKLSLSRETLILLTPDDLGRAAGALSGTLTYEGSCENSYCPCPTTRTQTQV